MFYFYTASCSPCDLLDNPLFLLSLICFRIHTLSLMLFSLGLHVILHSTIEFTSSCSIHCQPLCFSAPNLPLSCSCISTYSIFCVRYSSTQLPPPPAQPLAFLPAPTHTYHENLIRCNTLRENIINRSMRLSKTLLSNIVGLINT